MADEMQDNDISGQFDDGQDFDELITRYEAF